MEHSIPSDKSTIDPTVSRFLATARKKLVDTGTRNPLIDTKRGRPRNSIAIVNERADDVFQILWRDEKIMRFHASLENEEAFDDDDVHLENVDLGATPLVDESRFTDRLLDTTLGTDALQKTLQRLARDAQTAEDEQGINLLYLAIGFLRWFESERSEIMREGPLVLLPVELVRNDRTATYDVRARADEILTNLSLQVRLQDDFGISLPAIRADDTWQPSIYFDLVGDAIPETSRWNIDEHGIQLGFFSFAKQLMQHDLQQEEWPNDRLGGDPTIRRLLVDGFDVDPPLFGPNDSLDERLTPEDIVHVIDADSPQTKVIEEVRKGRNLIVQGPPGTGKSQTITNILAAAVYDGKKVLFAAEKMAALDVVHSRMKKCGLGDVCLELHSRKAQKREVLREIDNTLKSRYREEVEPRATAELHELRDKLNNISDFLHVNVEGQDYTAYDAIADLVGFIGKDSKPPRLSRDGLAEKTSAECTQLERAIGELVRLIERDGPRRTHPFFGCRELDLSPVRLARLKNDLVDSIQSLKSIASESESIKLSFDHEIENTEPLLASSRLEFDSLAALRRCADLIELLSKLPPEIPALTNVPLGRGICKQVVEALRVGASWASLKRDAAPMFREFAWSVPASDLFIALERGTGSGFKSRLARFKPSYRDASKRLADLVISSLPDDPSQRLALARSLVDVQREHGKLKDEEPFLQSYLSSVWRGEQTDFDSLLLAAEWLLDIERIGVSAPVVTLVEFEASIADPKRRATQLRERIEVALERSSNVIEVLNLDLGVLGDSNDVQDLSLLTLTQRFETMSDSIDSYSDWMHLESRVRKLRDAGLSELISLIDESKLEPREAVDEFGYACAEARMEFIAHVSPELGELRALDRHELVRAFIELDKRHSHVNQESIRTKHRSNLPAGAAGEIGIIKGEINRKRRHMPIRQLISKAGSMLQRIKPVFLMSPISIAQFLPPKAIRFDLLVIDEASQVKPEDAIGALARCDQFVIIGDQKQLPPTTFFDRLASNDEASDDDDYEGVVDATEMESVLTLCEARGVNSRMLEWHYRSRDPSLIRISNTEFYDGELILPPSPLAQDDSHGLSFERVPGVYASRRNREFSRPGTNRIEAEHVVQAVIDHAVSSPQLSLGIVTFSTAQRDMMLDLLEHERRQHSDLNDFLREGGDEDTFVKNIENVQGDERDVIFISVGYGPTTPGERLSSMRFGPINNEGGERRLNVLFTRARRSCRVFASFDPKDIDLARVTREGPRVLRKFLEYAANGTLPLESTEDLGPESPFEEDVANVIRSFGYLADHQVGTAGFRIDIGIRSQDSPDRYLLAVECDGARYHSSLSARERDRHRQEVLEGMNWVFHRIWSTDWFHRRENEKKRLEDALIDAETSTTSDVVVRNVETDFVEPKDKFDEPPIASLPEGLIAPRYQTVDLSELKDVIHRITPRYLPPNVQPHEIPTPRMAEVVSKVVDSEGPVHGDIIASRITLAFDNRRTGPRIKEATRAALTHASQHERQDLLESDGFWYTQSQLTDVQARDRSGLSTVETKPLYLPPMEIEAAVTVIEHECGRIEHDELIREVIRLFGFKKTGSSLRHRVDEILNRRTEATAQHDVDYSRTF